MTKADHIWTHLHTALARDDYPAAFRVLEEAMNRATARERGQIALYLAHVHALYGENSHAELRMALNAAYHEEPQLAHTDLARALEAEWQARETGTATPLPAERLLASPQLLARFHLLCALMLAERYAQAAQLNLPLDELPEHLRWRTLSWQAEAAEQLGHTQQAIELYGQAARLAQGVNRAMTYQEQATLYLNLGQWSQASQALEHAQTSYPADLRPEDTLLLATWHYLKAQTQLQLGQLDLANEAIDEAARLEERHGEPSYGVALVKAQIQIHEGKHDEALATFQRAQALAQPEDLPYINHELGVTLLDLDRPLEARERLENVLEQTEYPYQPEVLADIAECDYRLGRLAEAQQLAEQALQAGAVVSGSLVLGSVAMEYYHLDDALEHYERVIREALPESRDWVLAHQMAADILAQQGFRDPAAIYAYAQQALTHTPESDDWHQTLRVHLEKASTLLGQQPNRTLN